MPYFRKISLLLLPSITCLSLNKSWLQRFKDCFTIYIFFMLKVCTAPYFLNFSLAIIGSADCILCTIRLTFDEQLDFDSWLNIRWHHSAYYFDFSPFSFQPTIDWFFFVSELKKKSKSPLLNLSINAVVVNESSDPLKHAGYWKIKWIWDEYNVMFNLF